VGSAAATCAPESSKRLSTAALTLDVPLRKNRNRPFHDLQ
jgi:hypothetical protein